MNTHHLELFYYVARHGGISRACHHMPYGVQQPAVSAQIIRLEEDLGVKLFERKPFQLTDAGRELYDFAAPFFGQLDEMEARLRGKMALRLRLAGPTQVMRDHLPELLRKMERTHPELQLKLIEADVRHASELLERGEVDLSVVVLEDKPPAGLQSNLLIRLPMVLLVHEDVEARGSAELLRCGAAGKHRLITLPQHERMPRLFSAELRKRKLLWPVSMEASSTDLVARYVAHGLGVGLAVDSPTAPLPANVRKLPLHGFPALPIAALWKGKLPEVPAMFLRLLEDRGRALSE